ncbi:unnamed protein product [Paramecium sonneborni]|uniref:Uncharacterized protein n=1 Tax=Paramecium sonneborni TaxID=65129 RepID=A0A8S1RM30_9CILI|nr:unnamed protein product [Paramecium sonneborni]
MIFTNQFFHQSQIFGSHDDSEYIEQKKSEKDSKEHKNQLIIILKLNINILFKLYQKYTKKFSKVIITYIIQNKDIGLKIMNDEQFEEFVNILKDKKILNHKILNNLKIFGLKK